MQMNPIGWIEIPVTDLDRAEKFYKEYFDLETDRQKEQNGVTMSWFPMQMKVYGSAATLAKGANYKPCHDGPLVYFSAPGESVDAALLKAEKMNIKVLAPKVDIGEHGFFACIEDSEGNKVAVHSMKG